MSNAPTIPARKVEAYTAADVSAADVLDGMRIAYRVVVNDQMLYDGPQGVIDRVAEEGDKIGDKTPAGTIKLFKVTIEEVGTTE